jgi:hypothetical protein
MYLAQQFEQNMRVIIFLGDQWGLLPELKLTKRERERFKDDTCKFLDEAGTCGRLLIALVDAGLIKNRAVLEKAVECRNELAHWFLIEADIDNLTKDAEKALVVRLHEIAFHILIAAQASRLVRTQFENESDLNCKAQAASLTKLGVPELISERPQYKRRKKPKS